MNWNDRNQAQNKDEAIQALTDGIASNQDPADLTSYAECWGIPLALQGFTKTAQSQAAQVTTPVQQNDDDEDYYESSDYYYESSY